MAKALREAVHVPILGIGAGPDVDCQVLVTQDLLDMYGDFKPKFVKQFAHIRKEMVAGLNAFHQETVDGTFPRRSIASTKGRDPAAGLTGNIRKVGLERERRRTCRKTPSHAGRNHFRVARSRPDHRRRYGFSTFSVLFCGNILGWFGGSATFTIGVLQLSLAGLFFVGARERCKYATFWGNMNLIFAFYFGVLGGATNVLAGLNVGLDGTVLAIPNLIAGAVLCGTLPGARRDPGLSLSSMYWRQSRCCFSASAGWEYWRAFFIRSPPSVSAVWAFWVLMPSSAT